jgi:Porin subfamily
MWTSITAAPRNVAGRAARAIAAAAIGVLTLLGTSTPSRAVVDYVKICSLYGAGFFYIPGTDTCTYAQQTVDTQFAIARMVTLASTGSAMAASLVRPYLPDHTNFAISGHWALFNGQNALGFSGLMRLSGNLVFSAGVAFGLDRGNLTTLSNRTQTEFGTSIPQQSWSDVRVLGRVGLMYSW